MNTHLNADDSYLIRASLRAVFVSAAGIAAVRQATPLVKTLVSQTHFRHCTPRQPNAQET